MKNKHKDCCICSQIKGEKKNDLISNLLSESTYTRRIILENKNFAVLPSLGALTPGHLIICPKDHVKSIAQLKKAHFQDFIEIKDQTSYLLKKVYDQNIHFFEHGTAKDSSKILCTVDHAHMHILPSNVSIEHLLLSNPFWNNVGESLENLNYLVGNKEYLYYEFPDGRKIYSNNFSESIESQFMRKIFKQALGDASNWNWRENTNAKEADEVFKILKKELVQLHQV